MSEPAGESTPESLGVTTDALTGLVIASWGGVGTGGPKFTNGASIVLPLGVGSGWTCWLAGFRGSLGTLGNISLFQASASGDPADGVAANEWALVVEPDTGSAASGSAVCAPSTDLGIHDLGLDPPTILTGGNANTWCGLSEVNAFPDGPPHIPWSQAGDFATVSNNGNNPQLVGGAPTWTFSGALSNTAQATCARASVSGIWDYHIVGPGSFNLLQNNSAALPSGTVCFLTSVQGAFVNNNFNDGVSLNISSGGMWSFTATSGKSAWAMCLL